MSVQFWAGEILKLAVCFIGQLDKTVQKCAPALYGAADASWDARAASDIC